MDGGALQIALPVVVIVAAAVVTFYVVSFSEIREKSFKDLDDESGGSFKSNFRSRERRARRNAEKRNKN
ncbi:hypothetical protein LINPERPRIM_LOCUS10279 [Linum perenne]